LIISFSALYFNYFFEKCIRNVKNISKYGLSYPVFYGIIRTYTARATKLESKAAISTVAALDIGQSINWKNIMIDGVRNTVRRQKL
jgi:hypothetical protein